MKYKVTEDNNVSTVFLNGEIDMEIADSVREVVFPLIDAGKEVHLNLKDVQYMDSSGISVIIESNQRAKTKNTKPPVITRRSRRSTGPTPPTSTPSVLQRSAA